MANNENKNDDLKNLSNNFEEDGFVDFIDSNFEDIRLSACSRTANFIWTCK